ncbi:MAG: nucleotide sugar dehydrogenase [Chitinophagaceae bacterium]|nr:nucleotide sugar dehydrogenase [Chitinophagaceae bacterium]
MDNLVEISKFRICIIGLGYVGLPLAIEFGKKYIVVGFDTNKNRIEELKRGFDRTNEISKVEIQNSYNLKLTSDLSDIKDSNIFIVTVPTPLNKFKTPDLSPLLNATKMVAGVLKKGDIVIYESTVYPGCTEEDCVPLLEEISNLCYNKDFFCGYSPERINPGDKINTLTNILKVTSGSNDEISEVVDSLYKSIIKAGTYKASSIKVAEASKAIENAQRDVNISFVNELALIFDRLGIDTNEVLEAASTKWNFLKYRPGLVGGHCIGVDPYYLAHKAETVGYYPQVILSGRRVNDNMGIFVANKVLKIMMQKSIDIKGATALILGITFKENCSDIRNTKVVDIYHELKQFGIMTSIFDPHANHDEVYNEYGIKLVSELGKYDVIILAVSHNEFLNIDFSSIKSKKSIIFDTKSVLDKRMVDARL